MRIKILSRWVLHNNKLLIIGTLVFTRGARFETRDDGRRGGGLIVAFVVNWPSQCVCNELVGSRPFSFCSW